MEIIFTAEKFNEIWGPKFGIQVKQEDIPQTKEFLMSYFLQEEFAKKYNK